MKKVALCIAIIALVASWVLASCGDDDDGGGGLTLSCDATPCGGDVVGTWTFQEVMSCGTSNPDPDCPDSTMEASNNDLSGTVTFSEDGTYSENMTTSMDFTITMPLDCLEGLTDCSLLEQNMPGDATCTSVTDACECSGHMDDTSTDTGTWTTDANILILTSDDPEPGEEPGELSYCVSGNEVIVFDDMMAAKLTK